MSQPFPVRIGLLGAGTVGGGVFELIEKNRQYHRQTLGLDFQVVKASCRDVSRPRPIPRDLLTTDSEAVVFDESVDIVVEAAGGVDPFLNLLTSALRLGKPVVTANKELIAKHGRELLAEANRADRDLRFEACVCAGIPLIGALVSLTAANRPLSIRGIVNGSTNLMLTLMAEQGMSFEDALALCQSQGFVEAEPSADVDGFDAAYKLCILASVVLRRQITWTSVVREGIRAIGLPELARAKDENCAIKLVAEADFSTDEPTLRVRPEFLPHTDPLSQVNNAANGVVFESDPLGTVFWVGPGAGAGPTASALLGDVISIASQMRHGIQPRAVTWS